MEAFSIEIVMVVDAVGLVVVPFEGCSTVVVMTGVVDATGAVEVAVVTGVVDGVVDAAPVVSEVSAGCVDWVTTGSVEVAVVEVEVAAVVVAAAVEPPSVVVPPVIVVFDGVSFCGTFTVEA